MMWKQGSQKSEDGANVREIALDKQSKAARNDEQPEDAKSKKRTVLIAFGALLALCLAIGMSNCAASYKQAESIKNPPPEQVEKDAKTGPHADKDKVDEESQKAEEGVTDEPSGNGNGTPAPETNGSDNSGSAAGGGNGGNSGSNGGSGSSNNGGGSNPQHVHNWVAQTTVVHHDAAYQTIHHDAVYGTGVECNGCFAQFDSYGAWKAHCNSQLDSGNTNCMGYHTIKIVLEQAWDETVEVSPAWDETIAAGYACSGCGATK